MSLLDELQTTVGQSHVVTGAQAAGFLQERRKAFTPQAYAVVQPGNTQEVAAVVRCCAAAGAGIVPQSGNTGLVGGAAASDAANQVIINMQRMDAVRDVDIDNLTMTVESGCLQADAQDAARQAGLYFPLNLPSRDECRIGGNLATNAGGLNVVHYGNTRDLVLGLEVVLADGRVWHGLSRLRKDNSGFDLRDLFIGSEGALGLITAATFKVFPPIRQRVTALLGLPDPADAVNLLRRLRAVSGDNLLACELMSRFGVELVLRHIEGTRLPLTQVHPWYVLVDLGSSVEGTWLTQALDTVLSEIPQDRIDYRVAQDEAMARSLWRIRESIPAAQVAEGASIKHDISVPISRLPAFLARALPAIREAIPGVRPCPFGHVGDGNLHFNLTAPETGDNAAFTGQTETAHRVVHDLVVEMGGSIAAEHGIGRLKTADLLRYKSPEEIDLMRAVKSALDPDNRLNPGATVP